MALIEHLEQDDWREFLGSMFDHTLYVMKHDRHRHVGSSVSDLRAWLARGGVARIKEQLSNQMEMLDYPADKQADVLAFVDQLAEKHHPQLKELIVLGLLPSTQAEWLAACDITPEGLNDWVDRVNAGERPFDDWMYAHGHAYEDIVEVYSKVDEHLMRIGLFSTPPPMPPRRDSVSPTARRAKKKHTSH